MAAPFGAVPRAGPGRALALALRSRLAPRPAPQSRRAADVQALRETLSTISAQRYVVVKGPKGVGKTCAVETALQRTCGIVTVRVAPGAKEDAIVTAALAAVAGVHVRFFNPRPSARRVLWWYRRLVRAPPPVVVLRVSEQPAGEPFAQTAGAVRELLECGLRAVIDSSPNSLDPETLATLQQEVLELGPMPRDVLVSIPEHSELFAALRAARLEDAAWAVLGGVPAHFTALRDKLLMAPAPEDAAGLVARYLEGELLNAISRHGAMLSAHPAMAPVLELFAAADEVPGSLLAEMKISSPSPNKVLRAVRRGQATVLVPADAAMALVLRRRLKAAPGIDEMRVLFPKLLLK